MQINYYYCKKGFVKWMAKSEFKKVPSLSLSYTGTC